MSDTVTNLLDKIKQEAINSQPGILPPGKSMRNLIGHTVINISDTHLTQPQTEALQKGLPFCPSPGPPDKSSIWTDFKDFHRRLVLKHHFYNDNKLLDNNDQELIKFLAQNLDDNENPFKETHAPFKNKSTWKPTNTHISLNVFKQAFKTCLLNSKKIKKKVNKITSQKNKEQAFLNYVRIRI